jgi:hypothetical protein
VSTIFWLGPSSPIDNNRKIKTDLAAEGHY